MKAAVALLGLCLACRPLPPAPMVALHDDTSPAEPDATTATLVFGLAGELLGGDGFGVALRVERQVTDVDAVGGELTGGRGAPASDGGSSHSISLLAVRAYGRRGGVERDWLGAHYGLGLSLLSTGMVTATGFAGAAVSYPNDYVAPYFQLGAALAIPLAQGDRFGMKRDERGPVVKPEIYTYGDLGALGHFGDTGHRLSLDLGMALAWRNEGSILALSLADGQRFDP